MTPPLPIQTRDTASAGASPALVDRAPGWSDGVDDSAVPTASTWWHALWATLIVAAGLAAIGGFVLLADRLGATFVRVVVALTWLTFAASLQTRWMALVFAAGFGWLIHG